MRKIMMMLTVLLVLSFSSLALANGNWSATILPTMLKELSQDETIKAIKNYQGGLLAVHSPYFSQSVIERGRANDGGGIAILKQNSKNSFELAVPTDKVGQMWSNPTRAISFAHFDKALGFFAKNNGEYSLGNNFNESVDYFVGGSQDARGRILFIDSLSSVTDSKFYELLETNDKFYQDYTKLLKDMSVVSLQKNVEVTVLLDPVYSEGAVYLSDDKKQAVVILPIPYGKKGSKGANIKSVNGILSVQMFDTSSI